MATYTRCRLGKRFVLFHHPKEFQTVENACKIDTVVFALKQLRSSVLNELHTNSYTGPRLKKSPHNSIASPNLKQSSINPSE